VVGVSGLELNHAAFGREFRAWVRGLEKLGGCVAPVLMMGHTIVHHKATGAVVHRFSSEEMPYRVLMLPCRNRRESVCLPCSLLHNGDSFAIVRAGLSGGKGVPQSVATHPRVFGTVTAPSLGLVHTARGGRLCRPRRDRPVCPHGRALSCNARHAPGDLAVGAPLCPDCYDYARAVIWNASAGKLWHIYIDRLRRELAKAAGTRRESAELSRQVRLSYVKVAEFQRRGSVHFHAVIRLDGPDGAGDDPPAWASSEVLAKAARAAGPRVHAYEPAPGGGRIRLGLGTQLDARPVTDARTDDSLTGDAVSSYIAKYVTKGDTGGLVLPRRITWPGAIDKAPLTNHAKRMMHTAWDLGGLDQFTDLRTRMWSHQLGFRGNVITKSVRYSTTYGALRKVRADYGRAAAGLEPIDETNTLTESHYRFVGAGLAPQLEEIALGIAEQTRMRKGPRPEWLDPDEPGEAP
jgi:hypothetical protein